MGTNTWESLIRFFDRVQTDTGALLLVALLRLAALLGLIIYFAPMLDSALTTQTALGGFATYTLFLLGITGLQPNRLLSHRLKISQIAGDIGFYTWFYYLSDNPRSDIYLLYLLPLFTAVRFLDVKWAFPLLVVVFFCFNTILYRLYLLDQTRPTTDQAVATWFALLRIALARNFALAALMLFQQTQQGLKIAAQLVASDNQVRDLTRERARWFATYTDLGKRLAGFGDLEELQQFVVAEIQARLQTETSTLFLLDAQGEYLVRKATVGVEGGWLTEEKYRIGEGIVGSTLTTTNAQKYGTPIRTSDADHHPTVNPDTIKQYQQKLRSGQVKHLITVPLNGPEHSFGVLRVLNKLTPETTLSATGFSQEDEDFLMTIAAMMAVALENGRLLTEHKAYLQEIKALHDASQTVLSSGQQQDVLHKIVSLVSRVSGSAYTSVALVGEGGILSTSVEDRTTRVALHERARLNDGVTYQIINSRQMYICDDTTRSPQTHNPLILEMGYRSYAGLPIITRDKVRGVLFVHSPLPYAFCQKHDLLQIFCNHVATALENTRQYGHLGEVARVNARQRVSEELHEIVNFLHGSLIYGLDHQKTLLADSGLTAMAEHTDKLSKAAIHTYRALRQLFRDVQNPMLQEKGLLVSLQDFVDRLTVSTKVTFVEASPLELPDETEHAVYLIAQEAIHNAVKHAKDLDTLQITVKLCQEQDHFQLCVMDNGLGFDTTTAWQKNDSFGLQAMSRWAQAIGANLEISSSLQAGTTVCVSGQR